MDLFYFHTSAGNFGDDMNGWLWDHLLPGWQDWNAGTRLLGVGTILNAGTPEVVDPAMTKLVIGSGTGYGHAPDLSATGPWDIRAVRGPRTAELLGLPPEKGIIDPAMMVTDMDRFRDVPRHGDLLFVPHFKTIPRYDWPTICDRAGVRFLSASDPAEAVIADIAGARGVIAESMHAAILADAFGVPWFPVEISGGFNHFKWGDWADSLQVALPTPVKFFAEAEALRQGVRRVKRRLARRPATGGGAPAQNHAGPLDQTRFGGPLYPVFERWAVTTIRRVAQAEFALSDRDVLAGVQERYRAVLAEVIRDYS